MPTEIYIEALLVDEDMADRAWEAWDEGVCIDEIAAFASLVNSFRRRNLLIEYPSDA